MKNKINSKIFLYVVLPVFAAGCIAGTQTQSESSAQLMGTPVQAQETYTPKPIVSEYPKIMGNTVIIEYRDTDAVNVLISGDFNNWSTNDRMEKTGSGLFSKKIVMDPGKHGYKLIVDGNWITDPDNPNTASDGYGGSNSIVEVK